MRFNHIALRVRDIDSMLDFYCRKLGFEESFRIFNDDGSLRIVYIHLADGQYLELCLGGQARPEFDDQNSLGVRHICFTVQDLEETKRELEAKGVVFASDILTMRDHNSAAYLFDPEKNKIELVQTSPDSPQYKFENRGD